MNKTAYIPDRIFDGEKFIPDQVILVENGLISGILPKNELPADVIQHPLAGLLIAPAFIDLQIYGGNGKMFSLFPSVESLRATYDYCLEGGASHFMATVATNSMDIVYEAIQAVKEYWEQGLPGLLGLHLEGPYLNPEKKGAHLPQYIKKPELKEVKELLKRGEDIIRMITIAPECCSQKVTRFLADYITVSAGHSKATYEQANKGFQCGITTCTHLYNAMSPLKHREPGLVGAIFDGSVYSSIVADGIHVDIAAVRIAQKIMGDRLFLITDAVTEATTDSYTYVHTKDRYVTENGTLAGSCLTLGKAVKNIIDAGIDPADALRMASLIPAKVMGYDSSYGKIVAGDSPNWVLLDQDFKVKGTIIG